MFLKQSTNPPKPPIQPSLSINNAGRPGLKWRDTIHASRDTISSPERQATSDEIAFTTVKSSLQIRLFMQNKANFRKSQMNVSSILTGDYENETLGKRGKNKANSNPIKPNLPDAQMNLNFYLTKDYENVPLRRRRENKANTNPNKPNSNRKTEVRC